MNTLDQEIDAVVEFITKRWTQIDDLRSIVEICSQRAMHDFRAAFNDMPIFRLLEDMEAEGRSRNDPDMDFLDHVFIRSKRVRDVALEIDGKWDFESKTRAVINQVRDQHPKLKYAKPLGWDKLSNDYNEFDGIEEYLKTQAKLDRAEFKGEIFNSRLAPPLYTDIALPYVIYQDKSQGRPAYTTLVSVTYSHFLSFQEKKNTEELMAELISILDNLRKGGSIGTISNVHLALIASEYSGPEIFKEVNLADLTDEEIAERNRVIKKMIDEIKQEETEDANNKYKRDLERKKEVIKSTLIAHYDQKGAKKVTSKPR